MVLRILKEELWKRLSTRFDAKTRMDEDDPFPGLEERVQPVTDFDELAREVKVDRVVVDLSGGGNVPLFTVPKGKRWRIHHLRKPTTVGNVNVRYNDTSETKNIILIENTTSVTHEKYDRMPMDQEDYLYAHNGDVADISSDFNIIYEEEDAF